jgi:hypothetical protein
MLTSGHDPNLRRKQRYWIDRGYRQQRINSAREAQGLSILKLPRKLSWSITEVCDVLGVHRHTIQKYERLGIIPYPTYPSRRRVYWGHQVMLLSRLFQRMRSEGWPRSMPHVIGSAGWTSYLSSLRSEWRKGHNDVEWKGRGRTHDQAAHG